MAGWLAEDAAVEHADDGNYSTLGSDGGLTAMCRNIKMLFNFDPPVSPDEIHAASLQFVRKISGFNKPSKANEEVFHSAISAISSISKELLSSLETTAPKKNRDEEAARMKALSVKRFGDRKR